MEKSFWGPPTWCMIHTATAGYNPENRISFMQFIYSLPHLLPCEYCREHLKGNLTTLPITETSLANNKNLFIWSYFLHDIVNKQLRKPQSPPYQAIEDHYFRQLHNNNFWGPCFWRAIHSFAASYRPEPAVKTAFKSFIYSLAGVLPCKLCRDHYINTLNILPLSEMYMKDANTLFLWSFQLHDLVNKRLGKISPPFQQVKEQYFNNNICQSCGI